MAQFNFYAVSRIASTRDSVAWGKKNFDNNSTLVFAGLLVVCALAVGCSSEKPKSESGPSSPANAQATPPVAMIPASMPATPASVAEKPAHKKVVRRALPTLAFADKTSGVSFRYPRKYALKTGESAGKLVAEESVPMNFVQPGGVAIAAVTVPEGTYPKSDLAAAFFDVSVNKSLSAAQCESFPTEQGNTAKPAEGATANATSATNPSPKLIIGDMELLSSDTLASVGTRKEASKYYHVFENGACYEFALKVATTGETDEGGKAVNQDEVFKRLGTILATVKIDGVKAPEETASAPTAPVAASEQPAQ